MTTAQLHGSDRWATAGPQLSRATEIAKSELHGPMHLWCRSAAQSLEKRAKQRPAKKSEDARIFLFSFAPLTLNVKHGREIVLDPTPAEQPRGLRPHGLPHEVKPLKGNRLCQKGITARATTSSACQPSSGSMKARCAPSCTTVNHGSLRRTSAISSTSATEQGAKPTR